MLATGHTRPVDLSLAHTYIPGITCLLRATLLIITITLPPVHPPGTVLLAVAICLLLDRTIRLENIFDSNALLCTLHAAYVIQWIRQCSKPHFIIPPILFTAAQCISIAIATLLILDLKILPLHSGKYKRIAITLQAGLLALIVQAPTAANTTTNSPMCVQSFVFTILALVWTYAVGINDMVKLLGCSSRVPTGGVIPPKSSGKFGSHIVIVQSFTPCLVRFWAVLFMDGWLQLGVSGALACALVIRIYTLDTYNDTPVECSHPEYAVHCANQMVYEGTLPVAMVSQRIIGDSTMAIKTTPMPQDCMMQAHQKFQNSPASPIEIQSPLVPDDDYSLFQAAMLSNRASI